MTVRVAINGLGRIGRCVVRAIFEQSRDDIELVAVNGPAPIETHAHLLTYDSSHGTFPYVKIRDENTLEITGKPVKLFRERDPLKLPWADLGVDVVLECTGIFKKRDDAAKHLQAGAKKVLISSPAPDPDATIVYGVNHDVYTPDMQVLSVGSCTTNCLAPVAKVLHDALTISQGFMTTIHAYTNDQNILDNSHKDLRRARSAALSMVPTTTGAAKALALVIPELKGKLDGVSLRVPTPNVSMVDLTVTTEKATSVEAINQLMQTAADGALKDVLAYNDAPLVSIDYNHNPHSSIFDATGTKVMGDRFIRVAAWYDNEWGFSCRMVDLAVMVGK